MPIVGQFGSLAGLGSLILPGGAMESIATVSVGSGGASSIEFTSIPGTYQHLQIRYVLRGDRSGGFTNVQVQFNGDTGANYARHLLRGDGGSPAAFGSSDIINYQYTSAAGATASVFGAGIIDILDYGSTSKTKTVRALSGYDSNGSGYVALSSGLWNSTSATTSLKLLPDTGNWVQHCTVALYGLRAP